jgi:hypothetical protein
VDCRRLVHHDRENGGPDAADDVVLQDRLDGMEYVATSAPKRLRRIERSLDRRHAGGRRNGTLWLSANYTRTGAVANVPEVMAAEQADHDSPHGIHQAGEDDQAVVALNGRRSRRGAGLRHREHRLHAVDVTTGVNFSASIVVRNKARSPECRCAVRVAR